MKFFSRPVTRSLAKHAKKYRILLGLSVLVLLIALGAYAFVMRDTVILRADGFHPRTLTIHAGETVTFKSERRKYFWPASDFHPSHLLFPAFDAKKPISPDGSWSFKFDTPGTYRYHDHLGAYYLGVIKVVGPDGKTIDQCKSQLECWQNQIFVTLSEKGLPAAYEQIDTLYASDPAFAQSCHTITHLMGLASYQLYLHDPKSILTPKAVGCAAGFYHGFMEGYIGATGDVKGAAALCDTIGRAIGKESPDARLQCYHGIGHGSIETEIASTGAFDSLDAFVGNALANCELASTGKDERYRCVSGVYNATANFYVQGQYGLSLATSDPRELCARQKPEYKESCYGNINTIASWQSKGNFKSSVMYLINIPEAEYRPSAVRYIVGAHALKYVSNKAPMDPVVAECRTIPAEFQSDCIKGFAHGLMEHGKPGSEYVRALEFCGLPSLLAKERDACYSLVLGTLRGSYSEAVSEQICQGVAPALQSYCTKKATP